VQTVYLYLEVVQFHLLLSELKKTEFP
jgi:hypothetical protein